jgi:hypothetical protein
MAQFAFAKLLTPGKKNLLSCLLQRNGVNSVARQNFDSISWESRFAITLE